MCPEESASELAVAFDQVVIAWDHTAPAARAVADALPMLKAAASVRVITSNRQQYHPGRAGIRRSTRDPSRGARNQGHF